MSIDKIGIMCSVTTPVVCWIFSRYSHFSAACCGLRRATQWKWSLLVAQSCTNNNATANEIPKSVGNRFSCLQNDLNNLNDISNEKTKDPFAVDIAHWNFGNLPSFLRTTIAYWRPKMNSSDKLVISLVYVGVRQICRIPNEAII